MHRGSNNGIILLPFDYIDNKQVLGFSLFFWSYIQELESQIITNSLKSFFYQFCIIHFVINLQTQILLRFSLCETKYLSVVLNIHDFVDYFSEGDDTLQLTVWLVIGFFISLSIVAIFSCVFYEKISKKISFRNGKLCLIVTCTDEIIIHYVQDKGF